MHNDKMALLSLKPCFADSILKGVKQFEFRKIRIKENVQYMLLYASFPVKAFVGFIEIEKIIEENPSKLWELTNKKSGISKKQFINYFEGKNNGYAIEIKNIYRFKIAINPREIIENFRPPQSFMYINKNFINKILEMVNEDYKIKFFGRCSWSW